MKEIDEIWEQGNEQIDQDHSIESEVLLKSMAEGSRGITSGLLKPLRFGVVVAAIAVPMFAYNLFYYWMNIPLLIAILILISFSFVIIIFLWSQIRLLKRMDQMDLNLRKLLIYKIRYLNTRHNWALHCVSLSIVLVTFTINLSIENSDGIFELRKILILSSFYLFAYLLTFGLIRLSTRVADKQLKRALFNLEEQTHHELDGILRQHRRISRIIALVLLIFIVAGIFFMLFR